MVPFDSWNKEFKNIFGAVKTGTPIDFKILIKKNENFGNPTLIMEKDFCPSQNEYITMHYDKDADSAHNWYKATFTPKSDGLYFYYFIYPVSYGKKFICRKSSNKGEVRDSLKEKWQLTVYKEDFETPEWIKGKIIYQIFPDRFNKLGDPSEKIPSGRVIRDDWGGQPHYKPNEENKILNNDYFGGNFKGIIEKLPYLKALSVGCIYFNPIFEAHSNHRYDTADFEKTDPLLGNESDFERLCIEAEKLGIRILLDGVFSHTGADSKYFNKYGRYKIKGAYNDKKSPFYNWYKFNVWPNDYKSWWGINTLPEIIEENKEYIEYISGNNGILQKWQNLGAGGYRLDVADELPDVFLDNLRKSVKKTDPNALIIGEVWEDASNKISYGERRRYLLGDQLDSVMNYPFYNAIVDFLRGKSAKLLNDTVMRITENYPPPSVDVLMNHIGTHDTARIITLLAGEDCEGKDREWQASHILSEAEYEMGKRLLKMASAIQYLLPGVPSLYYGDEAGLTGYRDPFNRGCYPWGNEDEELIEWYKLLGEIRNSSVCLKDGEYFSHYAEGSLYVFERRSDNETLICAVNRSPNDAEYQAQKSLDGYVALVGARPEDDRIKLSPLGVAILKK